MLVDVLGNPYFVKCTAANISDDEGLLEIIRENKEYFLTLADGHIITILLDTGSQGVFGSRNREDRPAVKKQNKD